MRRNRKEHEDMTIRFIDLEKAYATIPRDMTMGTLMWIEVRGGGQIGGGDRKFSELCGPGVSGESKVNVGLYAGGLAVVEDGEANLQ